MRTISTLVPVVTALLGIAACAHVPPPPSPAPVLDGAYHDSTDGQFSWLAFHEGAYGATLGDADCRVAEPPATCDRSGTYSFDEAHGDLTLVESGTGNVTKLRIRIDETKAKDALLAADSLAPRALAAPIVGANQLVSGSSQPVVTKYTILEGEPAPVVQVGLRQLVLAACTALNLGLAHAGVQPELIDPLPDKPTISVTEKAGCSRGPDEE